MDNPCKVWNKKHKIGTTVTYTSPDRKKHITKTTHRAWLLGGTLPVTRVECEPHCCVCLENVKANIPEDDTLL